MRFNQTLCFHVSPNTVSVSIPRSRIKVSKYKIYGTNLFNSLLCNYPKELEHQDPAIIYFRKFHQLSWIWSHAPVNTSDEKHIALLVEGIILVFDRSKIRLSLVGWNLNYLDKCK
jgi:hypothetical protein